MNAHHFRWLLLALAGALLGYVVVQRRKQLAAALPEPLVQQAERIVIPWTALERKLDELRSGDAEVATGDEEAAEPEDGEEPEGDETQRRKVSRRHRISYQNKQYGPLPESLVGQYVEVEERDGELYILHNGTPVANFTLQR